MHAIGITVGGNTALNQGRVGTLSNWKACACGRSLPQGDVLRAARAGRHDRAQQVFEGPRRLLQRGQPQAVRRCRSSAEAPFGIMHAFTKRFPLGQYSQTVAQAAVEARRVLQGRRARSRR